MAASLRGRSHIPVRAFESIGVMSERGDSHLFHLWFFPYLLHHHIHRIRRRSSGFHHYHSSSSYTARHGYGGLANPPEPLAPLGQFQLPGLPPATPPNWKPFGLAGCHEPQQEPRETHP